MEVWGIMSTLILQDGPFLAMRLYIMVGRNVVHQMIVFFTCKNLLVVILQLYRLVILATAKNDDDDEIDLMEEEMLTRSNMGTISSVALAKAKFAKSITKLDIESPGKVLQSAKVSPEISVASVSAELPEVS